MIPFRELTLICISLDCLVQLYLIWRSYHRTFQPQSSFVTHLQFNPKKYQKSQLKCRRIYRSYLYKIPVVYISAILPLLLVIKPKILYAIGRYICDKDVCDFFFPQFLIFALYTDLYMNMYKLRNLPDKFNQYLKSGLYSIIMHTLAYRIAGLYHDKLWIYLLIVIIIINVVGNSIFLIGAKNYTKLPEGSLRTRLEKLANQCNFPIDQILFDNKNISTESFVYVKGSILTNYIMIDSRQIHDFSENELEASIAHELGHCYYNHPNIDLLRRITKIGIGLYLGSNLINNSDLYLSFGYNIAVHPVIGLYLSMGIINLLYYRPMEILFNFFNRFQEWQADKYAVKLGYANDLATALMRWNQNNSFNLNPDPLDVIINNSHPTIMERVTYLLSG